MNQSRNTHWGSTRLLAMLILASLPAVGLYIWRSQMTYRLGFPLDDAWIHQTYARNLAIRGEWAFLPGDVSAGSTAPLWTMLLSLGYLLSIPNTFFSFLMGWIILIASVWLIGRLLLERYDGSRWLIAGLLILTLFEWHLLWAALSGMETLLLGLHILLVLWGIEREWKPIMLGALVGLGMWIRPDAILAAIPLLWVVVTKHKSIRESSRLAFRYFAGFSLLALPYLYFNHQLGGELWPSTYYAKQLEYAVTRQAPLFQRIGKMSLLPMIGSGALLVPGCLLGAVRHVRARAWDRLSGLLWILAFIFVYALRLPVDYQHGRYLMPVIPVLFLLGYEGLLLVLRKAMQTLVGRVLFRSWVLSLILVTLIFWVRGAKAYAADVAIIETEMVAAAEWIALNTQSDDLIAVHDIGAMGYFGERQLLDLAGLVSTEVIPILRDEVALESFLYKMGADYLVTFPGWYPRLTQHQEQVFSTNGSFSPSHGGENMTIYIWR